jgi:oligo-1,6-glucosidase
MEEKRFFKENAVYQIYPRSFCDSNGDGIGDLKGIISKLDYLQSLGIGIIWLSPVYPSPNFDYGYDISNYKDINPEFGTLADMDNLIAEAKKRGIRIVMDLVVNHTSSAHPWFKASMDPKSPYHDYYIWRKGKNNNLLPPNNWTSNFTGPAWTYVKETDEWYLHLFTPQQPDLNWNNPKVLDEVESILRFWLDRGVYGFRCDVINEIYKSSLADGKDNFFHMLVGKEYFVNQEGTFKILRQLKSDVLSKYDTMTVGETGVLTYDDAKKFTTDALDMVFSFDHVLLQFHKLLPTVPKKYKPDREKRILIGWQTHHDWNANYFENHDQLRCLNKFGDIGKYRLESGKMIASLVVFQRGTPYIYEGQEIGMVDYPYEGYNPTASSDIVPQGIYSLIRKLHLPQKAAKHMAYYYDRDNARKPMQWDTSVNGGFSSGKSVWRPVGPEYVDINAAQAVNDPNSIFNYYKAALKLRKEHPVLSYGSIEFLKSKKDVMAFYRAGEQERLLVLVNLSGKKRKTGLKLQGQVLLSNYLEDRSGHVLNSLKPYETVLVKMK